MELHRRDLLRAGAAGIATSFLPKATAALPPDLPPWMRRVDPFRIGHQFLREVELRLAEDQSVELAREFAADHGQPPTDPRKLKRNYGEAGRDGEIIEVECEQYELGWWYFRFGLTEDMSDRQIATNFLNPGSHTLARFFLKQPLECLVCRKLRQWSQADSERRWLRFANCFHDLLAVRVSVGADKTDAAVVAIEGLFGFRPGHNPFEN
jgi:hypothetical protein